MPMMPILCRSKDAPLHRMCDSHSVAPDCTSFCYSTCCTVLLAEYHETQCIGISYLVDQNEVINFHHISHKLTTETQEQHLSILVHQMACALALVVNFHYSYGPGHP